MAESREERNKRVSDRAVEDARKFEEDQQQWADDNRDDEALAPESREEAEERVTRVRQNGIFGDMGTDPTTGDVQVAANDQEGGTVSLAESDALAEQGDEDAQAQDDTEGLRQDAHGLDEDELDAAADSEPATDDSGMPTGEREGDVDEEDEEK